jgi:phosphopantetheinyl transferase (holo-ACP synthase)
LLRVGNDIVDLTQPNANKKSRDTRFLKRVFLPDEEQYILADTQPEAMLWALWTGKEAAYKSIQKEWPHIPSVPRQYKVTIEREQTGGPSFRPGQRTLVGTVETPQGNLKLETLITPEYVHSIATSSTFPRGNHVAWRVERMLLPDTLSPDFESLYVRSAAKRRLVQYLKGDLRDIEIRRIKYPRGLGPPSVFFQGKPSAIDISLSHDGHFAAYAFTRPA